VADTKDGDTDVPVPKLVMFGKRSQRELDPLLHEIRNLLEEIGKGITWEYHEDVMVVDLDGEEITFTHWKSATAYLTGYLDGYHTAVCGPPDDEG